MDNQIKEFIREYNRRMDWNLDIVLELTKSFTLKHSKKYLSKNTRQYKFNNQKKGTARFLSRLKSRVSTGYFYENP